MGRRLCKDAMDFKCIFGNADGSCDKLDEFVLQYCKRGSKESKDSKEERK